MKHIKKILTLAMVVVMALTVLTFSGGAESIEQTAIALTSGNTVTPPRFSRYNDYEAYKINVSKSGTLKLTIKAYSDPINVYVIDSNDNYLDVDDYTERNGSASVGTASVCSTLYTGSLGKTDIDLCYKVTKGTYYIKIAAGWNYKGSENKINLTATFPSSSNASKGKVYYLRLTMDKGDTLGIGAVVSSGTKVTWTTSNSNVATVKNGKVTAKAKGSAIITAKCGTSSQKIKIVVQ